MLYTLMWRKIERKKKTLQLENPKLFHRKIRQRNQWPERIVQEILRHFDCTRSSEIEFLLEISTSRCQWQKTKNARVYNLDIIPMLYRNLRDKNMFRRIQSEGKQLGDTFRQNNSFFYLKNYVYVKQHKFL